MKSSSCFSAEGRKNADQSIARVHINLEVFPGMPAPYASYINERSTIGSKGLRLPEASDLDKVVFFIIGFPADPRMMMYNESSGKYEESIEEIKNSNNNDWRSCCRKHCHIPCSEEER